VLGLISVGISQLVIILFHAMRVKYAGVDSDSNGNANGDDDVDDNKRNSSSNNNKYTIIQPNTFKPYNLPLSIQSHLSQPEGFMLLGSYLTLYWLSNTMPSVYYSFPVAAAAAAAAGVDPSPSTLSPSTLAALAALATSLAKVTINLAITDLLQYTAHRIEHMYAYTLTHKPHHVYKSPTMFIAFHGSVYDTVFMILIPLFLTSQACKIPSLSCLGLNTVEYMYFGVLYSSYLTLIHSEYHNRWDKILTDTFPIKYLCVATSADHHVHHKLFKWNYGHLFMIWDRIGNTWIDPVCDKALGGERRWDY
jgi:sterol desaturase/sphingolipid hydroxylase (fatty acid hydroxylase superfamily)